MFIIILVVFLSVVSGPVGLAPLWDLLEMQFFSTHQRTLESELGGWGSTAINVSKIPQGSLMNIKVSETLELQESFNVLQELEITLNWGHLRRVEEGGGI